MAHRVVEPEVMRDNKKRAAWPTELSSHRRQGASGVRRVPKELSELTVRAAWPTELQSRRRRAIMIGRGRRVAHQDCEPEAPRAGRAHSVAHRVVEPEATRDSKKRAAWPNELSSRRRQGPSGVRRVPKELSELTERVAWPTEL